jgi:putative phage-type endonuclease
MTEIVQGNPEWRALRCGKVTASRVSDLIAKTKTGFAASRANLMADLIAERLTGVPIDGYTNSAMQWGTDTEPQARAAYEFYTDATVELAGFVPHPTIAMAGASPDGYVGSDGLVEIKCPQCATHIETLLGQAVPSKYVTQMQFQMATTGRAWCDHVSFDPRMPPSMQLFVKRVHRDAKMIEELEAAVRDFLAELDQKIASLTRLYQRQEAA